MSEGHDTGSLAFAFVEAQIKWDDERLGLDNMADLTSGPPPQRSRAGMDYTPPARAGAFKAAGRHTALVKLLRRAIVVGALLGVSAIAIVVVFDPLKHLPAAMSLAGVGVSGTKITMDHPKISGVQQGGGPYDIKARAGIQDILKPSVIDLDDVDARIGMADATTTHVLASHGTYDSKADTMALSGDVRIANTSGYTLHMKSALMNFGVGRFSSQERSRVDLKGGTVSADDMSISNNGHVIAFRGGVSSTFDPPEEASESTMAPETGP